MNFVFRSDPKTTPDGRGGPVALPGEKANYDFEVLLQSVNMNGSASQINILGYRTSGD